ncbi:hypothetical protein [Phycicoccus avicenniae]|uniref:hypothetical protein n=1 Tax=Phycicoccus avicenniae TaxID=2828860 RepID=UPI003D293959
MNDTDLMEALRTTRRVDDTTLGRVTDRHALDALRDGITLTDRHAPPTAEAPRRGRRLGRRGLTAGALGVVLAGGGVAWAATHFDRGPLLDGLSCAQSMTVREGDVTLDGSASGRPVSGDDVADCAAIRADAGLPALVDPVAFEYAGNRFVVSRAGVPAPVLADVQPTTPDADRAARLELDAALGDWVDGPRGGCFTAPEAQDYAIASVARAGLAGMPVRVIEAPAGGDSGPCALAEVALDGRSVEVTADARQPVKRGSPEIDDSVFDVSGSLRTALDGRCLSLADAEALARTTMGSNGHVSTVADEALDCANVDLVVGGDIQLTVRGPEASRP